MSLEAGAVGVARPEGLTAEVEESDGSTRIVLRPGGRGRWSVNAFLLVWLCGWAVGELFALGFLFEIAAAALGGRPSRTPTGPAGGFIALFLLVWVSFWTMGGLAAMTAFLRQGWGRDVLTLSPGEWKLWVGVGRYGWGRTIDPTQVRSLVLHDRPEKLVADVQGRSMTVTTLGTEADRRWLRDLLSGMLGHPVAATVPEAGEVVAAPSAVGPEDLPPGYQSRTLPDGSVGITTTGRKRLTQAGCLFPLALFWNGIVSVFVLGGLGFLPGKVETPGGAMTPGAWGYWLFLLPFIAIGGALLWAFVSAAFGCEEWVASTNALEIRIRIFGHTWVRRFTDAELALIRRTDSDGDTTWSFRVQGASGKRNLGGGDPAELRALARYLAQRTGWPLTDPARTDPIRV